MTAPDGKPGSDPVGVDDVGGRKAHDQEGDHVDHGQEINIQEGIRVELAFDKTVPQAVPPPHG